MKSQVGSKIDKSLKDNFISCVYEDQGGKWGKTGQELEKTLKLYLTLKGDDSYQGDPDVQELLEAARKTPCTHTHHHDSNDGDLDTNLDDEEYLDAKFYKAVDKRFDEFERNMKKAIAINIDKKVEQKLNEKLEDTYSYSSVKKQFPMDVFMSAFVKEYGEWNQVSYGELSSLAVQVHGVSDKRSVQNRINYLVGKGVIKEFSTNVYDVIY